MAVYKRGRVWWYKFTWKGEPIRESTKQTNKRVADQIEAAHRTSLAKGEVGIRDRKRAATVRQFATTDFLPFVRSTFCAKIKTLSYYENGTARLLEYAALADESLDTITSEKIAGYARRRQDAGMKVATVNRELQVLRRMFALAMEWGKVERVLPRVRMIPGEAHRERVISVNEEKLYLDATQAVGNGKIGAYQRALVGIRASAWWENYQNGVIEITYGKTDNARRRIPVSPRVRSILDIRGGYVEGPWIFPAPTKSGHIEPSSLQGQHAKACVLAKLVHFPLYTFRHTCLTRWAPFMDPWTLAYLAGHRDMSITKRYVRPQEYSTRAAMEKARLALSGYSPIPNTPPQMIAFPVSS